MPYKDPEKGKEYSRKRYQRDKKRNYKINLKKRYGISVEEVEQMFIAQSGSCAICLKSFKNKKDTHVDHDHQTGKVRQLLCNNCNVGIGYLKEDVMIVANALQYLKKWKT